MEKQKTKIFISCGQNKKSDEVSIANEIKSSLEDSGYDVYVAVEEQTLKGIVNNIFNIIDDAEYFIFVDFRREIINKEENEYRGSLFCHQELAIATFLQKEIIVFQEEGVRNEGILHYLQANPETFNDRKILPELIKKQMTKARWSHEWKNKLALEVCTEPSRVNKVGNIESPALFYHIKAENLHNRKNALNSFSYLKEIINLYDQKSISFPTCENKWSGTIIPNVLIQPKKYRNLDAFFVFENNPTEIIFVTLTDSGNYRTKLTTGEYRVEYEVIASNFRPATITTKIIIGTRVEDIKFEQWADISDI